MFKKFAGWFICFGLSFLVEIIGLTEQGKGFFYIHTASVILVIAVFLIILVIGGLATGLAAEANAISFLIVLVRAGAFAIMLFATWGATKLFDIDFYVAYQIMTFGQCLCPKDKKKEDD